MIVCDVKDPKKIDFLNDDLSEIRSYDRTISEMIFWPLMFKLILIIIIVMLERFIMRCIGYISRPSSQYREVLMVGEGSLSIIGAMQTHV